MFAAQQPARAKIIYSDGLVLAEFANLSEPPFFMHRRFGLAQEFYISGSDWPNLMAMLVTVDTNSVSFVVETVEQPEKEIDFICKNNSSSELKDRIQRCTGAVTLREIRPEEISEVEEFKANVKGK